jgi:hypothetical protein
LITSESLNKFDFEKKGDCHHYKWPHHCAFGMVIVFDSTGATFAAVAHGGADTT